jgi:hypothetical protein
MIAALIFLAAVSPPPETISGVKKDGSAYICTHYTKGPLLEFCVFFTTERR